MKHRKHLHQISNMLWSRQRILEFRGQGRHLEAVRIGYRADLVNNINKRREKIMKVKRIVGAIFIVAMALAVVWPSGVMAGKDNIKLALSDVLVGLDYYQTTARVNIQVGYMMFDPLLERDAKSGKLKPHLVTSWKVVNPTTWEFKLRSDVKFHNGNPFNAESVRFTVMERILDPAQQSPQRSGFKWIKNVEVIDNITFRIITEKPYPLVLQRLNVLFPYDPQWTRDMEAKHGKAYLASHTMGTGPFKVVKFVSRDRIELVRNDNYWKKGVPAFSQDDHPDHPRSLHPAGRAHQR